MENTISLKEIEEVVYTKEDLEQLSKLQELPIVFDDDCPETTPEQAIRYRRVNPVIQFAN